jgi:hypothetical protein
MLNSPLGAIFLVNLEPHTGARPSARLFVGLIIRAAARARSRIGRAPQVAI